MKAASLREPNHVPAELFMLFPAKFPRVKLRGFQKLLAASVSTPSFFDRLLQDLESRVSCPSLHGDVRSVFGISIGIFQIDNNLLKCLPIEKNFEEKKFIKIFELL